MSEKRIKQLLDEIQWQQDELAIEYGKTLITCYHCLKKTQIKNLTWIQTRIWVAGYGNNLESHPGYWKNGDVRIPCPKCDQEIRLIDAYFTSDRIAIIKQRRVYFGAHKKDSRGQP